MALNRVVAKQTILRTSLDVDPNTGYLQQKVVEFNESCYDFIVTTADLDKQYHALLKNEMDNRTLFNISKGRVFRCHIILHGATVLVIFNFYAAAIDGESFRAFINDLEKAYRDPNVDLQPLSFTYLDVAIRERRIEASNRNDAREKSLHFWRTFLDETSSTAFLNKLPYDRKPSSHARTGRGHSSVVYFNDFVAEQLSSFLNSEGASVTQAMLATVFAILFKLTHETDLQLATVYANRQAHPQLPDIVGPLVATLPLRCQISPSDNFYTFFGKIKGLMASVLTHADVPYHHILQHTHAAPLSIFFLCEVLPAEAELIYLDENTTLIPAEQKEDYIFDLAFKISGYPSGTGNNRLSCKIRASADLYDASTVQDLAQRFELGLTNFLKFPEQSLSTVSLVLPHEMDILHSIAGESLVQKSARYPSLLIHQMYAHHADQHPQKMALLLDSQSLSYAELLYASQYLSVQLITKAKVKPGDVIVQCVEKSIEMVSIFLFIE